MFLGFGGAYFVEERVESDFGGRPRGGGINFFFFRMKNPFDIVNLCFGSDAEVGFPEIVYVSHFYHFELPFSLVHFSNCYLLLNYNFSSLFYSFISLKHLTLIIYSFIINLCNPLSKSTAVSMKVEDR